MKLLTDNFQTIDRIGFVFNDGMINSKQFMNSELFFTKEDLEDGMTEYSPNVKFVLDIIKNFKITNIDYLVCNGLKESNWVRYFNLLNKETGVIVGASDNETGNLRYGGDWIMETTNEDVVNIYWNSNISNYTSTLVITNIIRNGGIVYLKYFVDTLINYSFDNTTWIPIGSNWPVQLTNTSSTDTLTVLFTNDLIIGVGPGPSDMGPSKYFIIGSNNITIDGANNDVIINSVSNYPGLVRNGTESSQIGYSNITIKNINVSTLNNSSVAERAGWLCHSFFGFNSFSILITNCHSNANIGPNQQCGFICGRGFGQGNRTPNSSNCEINNCSTSGEINTLFGGGICGIRTGQDGGIVNIINCSSSGNIISSQSGGICGQQAGQNEGTVNITNCYSTSNLNSSNSSGICGIIAGVDNGTVNITNCYSTSNINGEFSSGICGGFAGINSGFVNITNCYSTGNINGNNSSGICGVQAGQNDGQVNISNCYSFGNINGEFAGGICGSYFGYNSNKLNQITNCYSMGNISGLRSGGICGAEVGFNNNSAFTPNVLIENCYTLGNTSGITPGSICGGTTGLKYTNTPTVNIKNCYTLYGPIVSPTLPIVPIQTNCYIGNGAWNDSDASLTILVAQPTTWINTDIGLPWLLQSNNVVLMSLTSELNPNNTSLTVTFNSNQPTTNFEINDITVSNGTLSNFNTINNTRYNVIFTPSGLGIIYTIQVEANKYTNSSGEFNQASSILSGSLKKTISTSTNITQSLIDSYEFPVIINGGTSTSPVVITFGENIALNSSFQYFIIGSNNITIDGANNDVIINSVSNYPGLVRNGTQTSRGYSNITIKNINMDCISSSQILDNGAGWFCWEYYGSTGFNNKLINLSSNGNITARGGIAGRRLALAGEIEVSNCYSTGNINSLASGGIIGPVCGSNGGKVLIKNCYSTGTISGSNSSGIISTSTGDNSGKVFIENCYSTGDISGLQSAGIVGDSVGINSGIVNITNCYSTGDISNNNSSGICGVQAGINSGIVNITNCYSTGNINGNNSSGICGVQAGQNDGQVNITNCYSFGNINGEFAGGISGNLFGYNSNKFNKITNCYSMGNISGLRSGGICGAEVGFNNNSAFTPNVLIENCYTLGNTSGITPGSICGGRRSTSAYTNTPTVNIKNCYTLYGPIVSPTLPIVPTQTNTYVETLTNTWSDSNAKLYLLGTPEYNTSGLLVNPTGTVWADIASSDNSIPWLFSTFGYSPYTTNLTTTFTQTVMAGNKSSPSLDTTSGHVYTIIAINNNLPSIYPSISINSSTGQISVGLTTNGGTYLIKILQQSNYTLTNFELIVPKSPNNNRCKEFCVKLKENEKFIINLNVVYSRYALFEKYRIIKKPKHGCLSINSKNKLVYIPNKNYTGKDGFVLGCINLIPELSIEITFKIKIY